MFMLVITSAPSPIEAAAAKLAAVQGATLYEARSRLVGEPPRVVGTMAARDDAERQAGALVREGFGALVLGAAAIAEQQAAERVATLAFERDALVATLRDGSERRLAWSGVELIVRGQRASVHTTTREETTRSFSAGKALLTGGLVMQSKKTVTTTSTHETKQGFVCVYGGEGPPLVLYEQQTHYAFLGPRLQPSSLANFMAVVALLREHAPGAAYDERLVRAPAMGAMPPHPPGGEAEGWRVDVACAVLAAGLRGGRGRAGAR